MTDSDKQNLSSDDLMKSVIQRIATGPEMSKDISREEARLCMSSVLKGEIEETRSAIFLIALRMKRETDDECLGVHDAIKEVTKSIQISQKDIINIGGIVYRLAHQQNQASSYHNAHVHTYTAKPPPCKK